MSDKSNSIDNLRPILLSVIIGILQLFIWIEILVILVMIYAWQKDSVSFTQSSTDKGLIVVSIVLFLTYFAKRKISKLLT
jgi:hypothetical protein